MSIFKNLTTNDLEESKDTVGGFAAIPSGIYDAIVKVAYAITSAGGAQGIVFHYTVDGTERRETLYITTKKGENFYVDKNTNAKIPLTDFTTANDICLFGTGEPLSEQETEDKVLKVWNPKSRKEENTEVPVLTALIGAELKLGILRVIEDKNKKGPDGQYHPTGETIKINKIDKVFHPETSRTVNEYIHEIEEPEFAKIWLEKNEGNDSNKAKGVSDDGAGQSGTGLPGAGGGSSSGASGTTAPKNSLFAKK